MDYKETNAVYLGNCMDLIHDLPKDREIVIVTDPPFNIGYHYGQYDDDMDEADYYKMLKTLYDAVGVLSAVGGIVLALTNSPAEDWRNALLIIAFVSIGFGLWTRAGG